MSTVEASSPWLVRVVDWANPILVKELRQSLKSRQFVVTFMLLLTVAWLVSVFGLLMAQTQVQYGPAGRYFFIGFYVALAVATLLIVPFGTYKSLQSERDFNTFEILSVTTITPQEIVRGRLSSALVQCLIFYSAITPFMAFASTMQGFDAPRAAYVLVVNLLMSMMLSMASLMVSTLSKQRATQGLFSILLILQLIGAVIVGSMLVTSLIVFQTWLAITDPNFWLLNAAGLLILGSYFVLFQQISTANLTFESANHSTGIRITAMLQFWLMWSILFGYCWWNEIRPDSELLFAATVISIVHWACFGFAFTAELDSLSRRIRRDFPKSKILRLFLVPLLPGGARGYLYFLFHVLATWLFYVAAMAFFARSGWGSGSLLDQIFVAVQNQSREFMVITAWTLQLIIYGGINTALARWGQAVSELIKPAHVRVVTFLIFMAAIVGPQILKVSKVIDNSFARYHYLQVLDPINTGMYFARGASEQMGHIVLAVLVFLAFSVVLLNCLAMFQATLRVLNSHVRVRKPSDIKPLSQ